jgi:hypothetical protein
VISDSELGWERKLEALGVQDESLAALHRIVSAALSRPERPRVLVNSTNLVLGTASRSLVATTLII